MKRTVLCLTISLVVLCIGFSACSKGEEEKSEKGAIEKMTDEAADRIVQEIRTPLEHARSVQELTKERARTFDESLKEE